RASHTPSASRSTCATATLSGGKTGTANHGRVQRQPCAEEVSRSSPSIISSPVRIDRAVAPRMTILTGPTGCCDLCPGQHYRLSDPTLSHGPEYEDEQHKTHRHDSNPQHLYLPAVS